MASLSRPLGTDVASGGTGSPERGDCEPAPDEERRDPLMSLRFNVTWTRGETVKVRGTF